MKFITFGICLLIGLLLTPKSENPIIGKWSGEIDNQPMVELSLRKNKTGLRGSLIFSKILSGETAPSSKEEAAMIEPKLEGRELSFKLRRSDTQIINLVMKLTSENEAELNFPLENDKSKNEGSIKLEKIE